MPRRTGSATLPLHGGRAPAWLFERMARRAVDSAAVQVGFDIYHHSFFLSSDGEWAVVQPGMRDDDHTARRYHWLGSRVSDFVNEPHAAIASATPRAQAARGVRAAGIARYSPCRAQPLHSTGCRGYSARVFVSLALAR